MSRTFFYILISLVILGSATFASKLIPTSQPGTSSTSMVTLEDIYQKTLNPNYTLSSHNISTTSEPSASMHTLQDIWNSLELNSGLVWSDAFGPTDWYDAVDFCRNLTADGQPAGTWRLPTFGELMKAIADQFVDGGKMNSFGDYDVYWSGSEQGFSAWYGSWNNQKGSDIESKENEHLVRCVRGISK